MIGEELDGLRIDAELGSGGMGIVFLAEVLEAQVGLAPGTEVAVKVIHPHLLQQPGFLDRFLKEARLGLAVRSENVVETLDCRVSKREPGYAHFLVMEYVEGQTLRQLVEEMTRVPEDLCRHVGAEVAKGLAAIHQAGVLHRDVKPENVLITDDRIVKVMDLGVARLKDEAIRLSHAGAFVGSLEYAAPEQFRGSGRDADGRSDLYGLGIVLYELATGEHPYRRDDAAQLIRSILDEEPRRIGELCPQVSAFFEEVVHRLLAKQPDARFGTAAEVAAILAAGEEGDWWRDRGRAAEREAGRVPRRVRIAHETGVHGRDGELGSLSAALSRAHDGAGQVVLIEGEAGVGKSRLVEEFGLRLQARGQDVNVLFGAYGPGGGSVTGAAFSTALAEQLGQRGSAPYLRQTPLLVPAFDALLTGDAPPPGAEPLTPGAVQTCFVHVIRALAEERPTILIIDDLHLASDEGRALFTALASAVRDDRVLLVGTTRPGVAAEWLADVSRLGYARRTALSRLDADAVTALLEELLESKQMAADLGERIAEKSDGNPFFIFELLRSLREAGHGLEAGVSTWAADRQIASIEIPSSVLDLVKARVAALDERERDALDVAACIGFSFDPTLLGEVTGSGRIDTLKLLGQIERRHRLVRAHGREFVFDHRQVQEVLRNDLSELLREAYHGSIAVALERRAAGGEEDPDEDKQAAGAQAVELATHLLAGGQPDRARKYLGPALAHLEGGGRMGEAAQMATRALDVAGLYEGKDRATLLLHRVQLLGNAGDRDGQWRDLAEASDISSETHDSPLAMRVASTMGRVALSQSRIDEAREHFRRSLSLARESGDRRGVIGATGNLGLVLQAEGHLDEASEYMHRTLKLAKEADEQTFEAAATGNLGNVFQAQGDLPEAERYHRRNLELAQVHANRASEAAAWGNLAAVLLLGGRIQESYEAAQRHLSLARAVGDRSGEALARCNLGAIAKGQGLLAEAHQGLEHSLALAVEIDDRRSVSLAMANVATVLLAEGRVAEARQMAEDARRIAAEAEDRRRETVAALTLSEVLACEGELPAARETATRALALARESGDRVSAAYALRALGELLRGEGRNEDARGRLQQALEQGEALGLPGVRVLAAAGLALLPGGDAELARAVLKEAGQRLQAQEMLEAHFLLWCATMDDEHLDEAGRVLDALVVGAPADARESMIEAVPLHAHVRAARLES